MKIFNYATREPGACRIIRRDATLSVELFAEYTLWKDMQRAEQEEDYEQAKIYRDELIRRGKLEPGSGVAC